MIRTSRTSSGSVVSIGSYAAPAVEHLHRDGGTACFLRIPWHRAIPFPSPLRTLCWRSRDLPLIGRASDHQALLDWARSGPGVRVRLLVGDAGSGKTRLAAEVAHDLQQEGWSAGFVRWSGREVWRIGDAGALLIVDDPFDAEGPCWESLMRAPETICGDVSVRLLVLGRDRWRGSGDIPAGCSVQTLTPLSMADAEAIHVAARLRHAARPGPFPSATYEDWAAAQPDVRRLPLYAIASAISLGYPPWEEGYSASSRRAVVGLAQATHNLLEAQGQRLGLASGVVPLLMAMAEARGVLSVADLEALARRTALTRTDVDTFMACVTQLPTWEKGALQAESDSLPRAAFVRMELRDALHRGLGIRIGAAMQTAHLYEVAQLDRALTDEDTSVDVRDRVARAMPLLDDQWLLNLEVPPRAGSVLGRLALHAAERRAPALPIEPEGTNMDEENAGHLVKLARELRREDGPAAAVTAIDAAVVLYRRLADSSEIYHSDLFEALGLLGDCLQESCDVRAGEVRYARVVQARLSADEADLVIALTTLGDCPLATDERRAGALRELAEIHAGAGRHMHTAVTLESLAAVVSSDEAASLVREADRLRTACPLMTPLYPGASVLEQVFDKLRDGYPSVALLAARLQAKDTRHNGRVLHPSLRDIKLGAALERVGAVADVLEAREALSEAVALYQRVVERTSGGFGTTRLHRASESLAALANRT